MKQRKFSYKGYEHVCQISVDRGIIFYRIEDYLVFFTLLCTLANKYNVHITALCIMRNHFHIQAQFDNRYVMASFLNSLCSSFARIYNHKYKLSGRLFKHSYLNSPKTKDNRVAENNYYICNNPKVKLAVNNVEDYRWNFLKYRDSEYPFSSEPDFKKTTRQLFMAYTDLLNMRNLNQYVTYRFFNKYKLNSSELQQLADHVIYIYNVIDYGPFTLKHGSFEKYLMALNTVSGDEYDLSDDDSKENYQHYDLMDKVITERNPVSMTDDEKLYWDGWLKENINSTEYERHKYLHLGLGPSGGNEKVSESGR